MLFVNIAGLALIGLIVWWFWGYRGKDVEAEDGELVILVENGTYQPAHVKLPPNRAAVLRFLRKDPSPCAETVVFPKLELSLSLPLDKTTRITLPPLAAGEYDFHCQMQMYRGSLKVE